MSGVLSCHVDVHLASTFSLRNCRETAMGITNTTENVHKFLLVVFIMLLHSRN